MKKKLLALGGICALAVVGATFAYYNQTTTVKNPFNTTSFEGTTVEKFNPKDGEDWKPGVEVSKEVYAKNTGEGDVWVRIRLDEQWNEANGHSIIKPEDGKFFPEDAVTSLQSDEKDGKSVGDGSVVYKNITLGDNWVEGTDTMTKRADGWYYYNLTLHKDDKTENLLDHVTLCLDTDMGKYNEENYYAIVGKDAGEPAYPGEGWVKFDGSLKGALDQLSADATKDKDVYTHAVKTLDGTDKGYSNDGYTLTITTEFIQANDDAQAARAAGWNFLPTISTVK